ncbi:MAG: hypothetical protein ACQESR_02315 [Planctomycetota bacterium]
MAISDTLAKLLELLGVRNSEKKKFQRMEQSLREKRAINDERLDALKDQIGLVERKVLAKKREYETARGDTKRIVGGEIERLFKELDRSRGQEDVLARNLEQIGLGLAKLAEIKAALDSGVDEGVFDELALELQDIVGELKVGDQAAKDLAAVQYAPTGTESVDIDARMAALEADAPASQIATANRQPRAPEGLSQESLERMRELDSEE